MRRAIFGVCLAAGCASTTAPDVGLEGISLTKVAPGTIVPGTKVVLGGASFVDVQWGSATLKLTGDAGGNSVSVEWPAKFVDFSTMIVEIDGPRLDEIGGDVEFSGKARVDVVATSDGQTYSTDELSVDLQFRELLAPSPVTYDAQSVIFVNDQIQIEGDGFLLGGDEGETVAKLEGCFTLETGGGCTPIDPQTIAMLPLDPLSRERAAFPFAPKIAGIRPGTFVGSVTIENQQPAKPPQAAAPFDVTYEMVSPQIFTVDPPSASLGQYVFVRGGGFVGGEPGANTELELSGQFTKTGLPSAPINITLIPEFVEGRLVRYIVNEDDAIASLGFDFRKDTGSFTGTITPVIEYQGARVVGQAKSASFQLGAIKQIVYLLFQPTYVEGLRDFGLRAVDRKIRDRIVDVCNYAYQGINIEFRTEPPTDFALYEIVELVGVDPNGQGLFGYDNTPGKDNGNVRLYDRLGGVNAATQQDGYPGYGGVFVRSLMGFSKHPGDFAMSVPGADEKFDKIFDPFRSDLGNDPIRASDLSGDITSLSTGSQCPGSDRRSQIECAVFVMGNLIGGTLSHEIGHSLGLANPYMEGFHNAGDAPNRIMDGGGDRSFLERAELEGQGPGVFCDDEYAYLRQILPSDKAPPDVARPSCF